MSNSSIQSCGTSCTACVPPAGTTATCNGTSCGYSCGGTTPKNCAAAMICIPSTGCCINSDCPTMAGGQVGTCDSGTNTCNYNCPSTMKSCTAGGTTSCIPSTGCCTNGDCTGSCVACSTGTHTCVAATNEDDPNGRCAGTCDSSGACKSKQGQVCNTVAAGCVGGTTCSPDGYCCNTACTGSCVACDLTGLQGTCTNLATASAPHSNHAACTGAGTTCAGSCNGSGACSYPTVSCGSASCTGSSSIGVGACSAGTCVVPTAQPCGGHLTCGGTVCKTSCTADADCQSGYFCSAGTCHLAAIAIATGEWHVCVLLSDGTVRCWGSDFSGELGNGMSQDTGFTSSATPVSVIGLPGPASAIAAGNDSTCALIKSDGSVWCWGDGSSGQLGNGSIPTTNSLGVSTPVKAGLSGAASVIAMGLGQVCAIVSGSVYCWGGDGNGEVGNGQFTSAGVLSPTKVAGVSGATALGCGYYHTCAGGGTSVWCWGDNAYGELGNNQFNDPTTSEGSATAQAIVTGMKGTSVQTLSGGSNTSCGLFSGGGTPGGVFCWGENDLGELGTGTVTTTTPGGIPDPQATIGLTSPTIVNAGGNEVCAVNSSGALLCWGDRTDMSGATYMFPTPGAVAGLPSRAIAISSASAPFACALVADGSAWCWGGNLYGVLGSTTLPSSTTPVQIPGW
jgi:alpha-tubulin suppressor-like RCC1 family protein